MGRADHAQTRLRQASVGILGLGPIGNAIVEPLAACGVRALRMYDFEPSAKAPAPTAYHADLSRRVVEEGNIESIRSVAADGLSLLIVDADRWTMEFLAQVNHVALETSLSWMVCGTDGSEATIGPTFLPGETCCFGCYQRRRRGAEHWVSGYDAIANRRSATTATRMGFMPGLPTFVAGLVVMEAVRFLCGVEIPATYGTELCFDLATSRLGSNPVLKLPRCPDCGNSGRRAPLPAIWMTRDN